MNSNFVYEEAKRFKDKYPLTIVWRLKAHSKVVNKHMNNGEFIKYVFTAQKSDSFFDIFSTCVVVITNKRLLIGMKRLFFGYFYTSVTPDLFNDLKVKAGLIYGKIYIDTVGEFIKLSKIPNKALDELETEISENIMQQKKEYYS